MRWIASVEQAPGPGPCAWLVRLDDEAAQRAAATPSDEDLAHAATAQAADGGAARLWRRRLLRALAARWLDVHPAEIAFPRSEPRRAQLLAPAPLFVSAASRGAWTVVAAGPAALGVDVELAGAEIAALGGSSPEPLRRWTAAEAYMKATGCSLDLAWDVCARDGLRQERPRSRRWRRLPRSAVEHLRPGSSAAQRGRWIPPEAEDEGGVQRLQAPGYPACTISWRAIGESALAAAASEELRASG
jgi:hypothetical protein